MAKRDALVELITTLSETPSSHLPPRLAKIQKAYLDLGKREDSVDDQVSLVLELGTMAGCYDGVDAIRAAISAPKVVSM